MSTKMRLTLDIEYEGPETPEQLKDHLWRMAFRCADEGLMSLGLESTVKTWDAKAMEVGCVAFDEACGQIRNCHGCPHNSNKQEKTNE